jgi:uncharacterized LabA/DUF88 family protein
MMERVAFYIDGFNLYFGLLEQNADLKWLDVRSLCENYLQPNQEITSCKYFTARINNDQQKQRRQNTYLEALETTEIEIIYGKYHTRAQTCWRCNNTWPKHEEKMTDVNIAVSMLTDAMSNAYDTAILISADSDLVPPVRAIRNNFKDKKVIALFPPDRNSYELKNAANHTIYLGRSRLKKSQFASTVVSNSGFNLTKPGTW